MSSIEIIDIIKNLGARPEDKRTQEQFLVRELKSRGFP